MFTENQVRQFYVVNSVGNAVNNSSAAGTAKVVVAPGDQEFYMLYKGPAADGLQRSDLVKFCNIMDIRATEASEMEHKMKKVKVTLDSSVNGGAPIVGQDYVLNVDILNYIAIGFDSTLNKFAAARAYTTTASDLYKALAVNLAKNFSRESVKLLKITLDGISGEVDGKTKAADISGTATGIIIEEVEQPWRRGAAPQEFVNFVVTPSTVYVTSVDDDLIWGTVTDMTADNTNKLPNSKKLADMEWFFHKERGDQYGELGWPINIDTTYQIDPANTAGYSVLDIHYYFEGNSHNIGHSEKTLTLVGTKAELQKVLAAITPKLDTKRTYVKAFPKTSQSAS